MRTIGLKPGDRVLLIERRHGIDLVHNALAVAISMQVLQLGGHGEMPIDAVFVPPEAWGTGMRFVSMERIVHVSHPDWAAGRVGFAYEELPPQSGVCRYCGCSDRRPCVDGNGETCSWVDAGCTVCSNFHCLESAGEEMSQLQGLEAIDD